MKRWLSFLTLALGMLAEIPGPNSTAHAAGLMIAEEWTPPNPDGRTRPSISPIPPRRNPLRPIQISRTDVESTIKDQVATTRIDQEFYNPNSTVCEGIFLFPVPRGSHIEKFTLEINGKPMEAEFLAADKARRIYEDIVRQRLDPALLEYAGRDLFRVRIFPFDPQSKRRITLSYTQVLVQDQGMITWQFPLARPEQGAPASAPLKLKVNLQGSRALKTVYSPSHSVQVAREGERNATVTAEIAQASSDADFQLILSRSQSELGMDVLAHRVSGEEGYFMLVATPEFQSKKPAPKDLVFVLDSSGSMSGKKLEQAKRALRFCVENVLEEDRFEILRFSSEVEGAFQRLKEGSRANREQALAFIDGIRPTGGTAIHEALKQAMQLKPATGTSPRSFVVVFLTDGLPTVGISDEKSIVSLVTSGNTSAPKDGTRVFCFGIGHDVNTHLLDRITESTHAASAYVLPDEDIEVKVSTFFTRIQQPALTDVELIAPEGVRWVQMHPSPLPDLFKGQQVIVAGRYRGEAKGKVTLRGRLGGEERSFSVEAVFPASETGNTFIPRLWATRRIGHLLDEIRLRGESQELKDEVTELARKFAVITPYTAYLVQEDEQHRGVVMERQSLRWAQEPEQRRNLRSEYDVLLRSKSGEGAVADARSLNILKDASSADRALQEGNFERYRGAAAPAAPVSSPATSTPAPPRRPAAGGTDQLSALRSQAARDSASALQQQARYVAGRSFYLNGEQWVDGLAQKVQQTQPVRVAFASKEYFELLQKHPEAKAWFALGQNLQVVIAGTLYEIHPL